MNQKGFATLEVILMITVLGILAAVAIPRFTDVTTKANTAKIQADLSTLDSAIQIYYMEKGEYPKNLSDLSEYVNDIPEPPTGKVFVKDQAEAQSISGTTYGLTNNRATLDGKTVNQFGKNTKSTT